MAAHTPTTGATFIPEIWAKEAIIARDSNLVAAQVVDRHYESDANFGDTIHVPTVALLTADTVTPGTPLTPAAPTESEVQILLDKFKGKAVQITDVLKKQRKYNLAEIYGKRIGMALSTAIDTDVWAQAVTGQTNTAVDAGAAVTLAKVVNAMTTLDAVNVPLEERALVVEANTMGVLRQIDTFTRYDATGSAGVAVASSAKAGLVGHVYGVPVYMSNNIPSGTVSATNKWKNILLHKSAIALVVQKDITMEKDRTALNLADDIVGSCVYGVKTMRANHSVLLYQNV